MVLRQVISDGWPEIRGPYMKILRFVEDGCPDFFYRVVITDDALLSEPKDNPYITIQVSPKTTEGVEFAVRRHGLVFHALANRLLPSNSFNWRTYFSPFGARRGPAVQNLFNYTL